VGRSAKTTFSDFKPVKTPVGRADASLSQTVGTSTLAADHKAVDGAWWRRCNDVQYNGKQRLLVEDLGGSTVRRERGIVVVGQVDGSAGHGCERGRIFSQSTAAQMSVQMLKSEQDFMTLATRRISQLSSQDREAALISVVSAPRRRVDRVLQMKFGVHPLAVHLHVKL